jgi:hypothetical protein
VLARWSPDDGPPRIVQTVVDGAVVYANGSR